MRACVSELRERKTVINRLTLNAGVMTSTPSRPNRVFETQFGQSLRGFLLKVFCACTKHLGHFLLTNLLLREKMLADVKY